MKDAGVIYAKGMHVYIDGMTGFCDSSVEAVTDIGYQYDVKTGVKYQAVMCGDQHYRGDTGKCIQGAKAYYLRGVCGSD